MEPISKTTQKDIIAAAIFDLDGLLLDSEWIAFQCWREIAEEHGGRLDDSAFSGTVGLSQEATAAYVMRHAGVTFDVADSSRQVWQRVMERLKTETNALPGAVELVRTLAGRKIPLAIASNALTVYIENALDGLGLKQYFPVTVSIDQVAQGKPAPDVYCTAAQRLGVDPARCLAFEDSRVGVQAAAAAGMRVIAVPDQRSSHSGDGYQAAWRVYPSLEEALEDLDGDLLTA
jgi:HAD superfamily hydrolase (TIGR01509 family)